MSRSNLSILEDDILTITIPETALPDKYLSQCMRGPEPIVVPSISDLVSFTASARDIHTLLTDQLTWRPQQADGPDEDEADHDDDVGIDAPSRHFHLKCDGGIEAVMQVIVCGQAATIEVSVEAPRKVHGNPAGGSNILRQPSQFDLVNRANEMLDEKLASLKRALGAG